MVCLQLLNLSAPILTQPDHMAITNGLRDCYSIPAWISTLHIFDLNLNEDIFLLIRKRMSMQIPRRSGTLPGHLAGCFLGVLTP